MTEKSWIRRILTGTGSDPSENQNLLFFRLRIRPIRPDPQLRYYDKFTAVEALELIEQDHAWHGARVRWYHRMHCAWMRKNTVLNEKSKLDSAAGLYKCLEQIKLLHVRKHFWANIWYDYHVRHRHLSTILLFYLVNQSTLRFLYLISIDFLLIYIALGNQTTQLVLINNWDWYFESEAPLLIYLSFAHRLTVSIIQRLRR